MSVRSEAIELLRCAADVEPHKSQGSVVGMYGALPSFRSGRAWKRVWDLAWKALEASRESSDDDEVYRREMLEAARLLEEGWSPC